MRLLIKYSESIKPISFFKNNMARVIRQLNEAHSTMIITQNGEAKAVVIDIKQYE